MGDCLHADQTVEETLNFRASRYLKKTVVI